MTSGSSRSHSRIRATPDGQSWLNRRGATRRSRSGPPISAAKIEDALARIERATRPPASPPAAAEPVGGDAALHPPGSGTQPPPRRSHSASTDVGGVLPPPGPPGAPQPPPSCDDWRASMPTYVVVDLSGDVHHAESYDQARRIRARLGGTLRAVQPEDDMVREAWASAVAKMTLPRDRQG